MGLASVLMGVCAYQTSYNDKWCTRDPAATDVKSIARAGAVASYLVRAPKVLEAVVKEEERYLQADQTEHEGNGASFAVGWRRLEDVYMIGTWFLSDYRPIGHWYDPRVLIYHVMRVNRPMYTTEECAAVNAVMQEIRRKLDHLEISYKRRQYAAGS